MLDDGPSPPNLPPSDNALVALAGDPAAIWDSAEEGELVCRAVRDETHDVRTFLLASPSGRLFRYQPGQYLTLELDIGGAAVSRCYTLSSTPTRPHLVSITVKRTPGGEVSEWLHANVRPGTRLRAGGIVGEFTCAAHPAARALYLSAGSGITPLMSMARAHDDLASGADIAFLHFARTPADIPFRAELETMARHREGFRFVPVCERDAPREPWHGFRGRIDPALLRVAVPDFGEREVFTCGPAPFMAAARAILGDAGFDMRRYHEESFEVAELEPPAPDVGAAQASVVAGFTVEFARSGVTVQCGAGTSVLAAAKAVGLRLPFACAKGVCGTCKSRIVSGRVDMQHGGGIRPREVAQGLALLCCSRPLSDLVVDR